MMFVKQSNDTRLCLGLTILSALLMGCGQYQMTLDQPSEILRTKGEICLDSPEGKSRINKILFVVDKSGSNIGDPAQGYTGNDVNDARRAGNIQNFLDLNRGKEHQEYGYIAFGVETNKAHAYINEGSVGEPKFGDENDLQNALNQHRSTDDDGCTPYLAALQLAKQAIENDLLKNPHQEAIYNVIFMSDGFPNDANAQDGCGSKAPVQNTPTDPYIRAVNDLNNISPNKIFLSTAYYALPENDPDRKAADGLKFMADTGGGRFVDLGNNDRINFDDIRVGPTPESWIMKRMDVVNLNAALCEDGNVGADSDSDGLCDRDEIAINQKFSQRMPAGKKLDPTSRNSLHADYTDLFSYKFEVLPTGEGLPHCRNVSPDKDHDLLNSCEEFALSNHQANGPTQEWTESMREAGEGVANSENPDSDGDGFLDFVEYFHFGVKSAAVNYLNILDRYTGGVTAETLMTEMRHPKHPNVLSSNHTDFRVTYNRVNYLGQNCYNVDLEQLALFDTQAVEKQNVSGMENLVHGENENILLVYYLATKESDPNGKGYFLYKFHKVKSHGIRSKAFLFSEYNLYKIPE